MADVKLDRLEGEIVRHGGPRHADRSHDPTQRDKSRRANLRKGPCVIFGNTEPNRFPKRCDLGLKIGFLRQKNEIVVVGRSSRFRGVRAGENCNALNFAGFLAE
jgi:hypothetical protein